MLEIFYIWLLPLVFFLFLGGCDPNPCKNGGKCSERTYEGIEKTVMKNALSFKCECPVGTSGARCEYVEGNIFYNDIYIYYIAKKNLTC